MEAVVPESL